MSIRTLSQGFHMFLKKIRTLIKGSMFLKKIKTIIDDFLKIAKPTNISPNIG